MKMLVGIGVVAVILGMCGYVIWTIISAFIAVLGAD